MAKEAFLRPPLCPMMALWPDPRGVLEKTGLGSGMHGIDLCCGNGHFTTPMAALVGTESKVKGVDMDPNLLNLAKVRMQSDANKGPSAICVWHLEDAY